MSETTRQDQASCTLTVDGRELPFVFKTREGGEVTAESSKTFPGGMRPQRAHGAPSTVEDVTLAGEFVPDRDADDIAYLKARNGAGDCGVVENLLDVNGNVLRRINSWTGKLTGVNTGSYDAESSEPRMFEITVSTHGITP